MSNYTPRQGTDTHKLISYLVKHAPFGGDKWLLSKTLAEGAELKNQATIHTLFANIIEKGVVLRDYKDERLRWQAGPHAVDALKRSEEVQPIPTVGFPNEKPREKIEFTPREGGAMDRAIKFLKEKPEDEIVTESELIVALSLPENSDLVVQFKPAVEAGALEWTNLPVGTQIVRHWALGDGFAPHKTIYSAPVGKNKKRKDKVLAPVAPPQMQNTEVVPSASSVSTAVAIPVPVVAIPTPLPMVESISPRGAAMPFRAGIFTNGVCSIQKGYGSVDLEPDEVLQLFELIAPVSIRNKKR